MAKEIERKYKVSGDVPSILQGVDHGRRREISQFYIVATKELAVRLRKDGGADHAVLAVKSGGNALSVDEHEFNVDATEYELKKSEMVGIEIVKTRYEIDAGKHVIELDVFHGELSGLVVAEVELESTDDTIVLPEWIGDEVTFDVRYKNAVLAVKGLPE